MNAYTAFFERLLRWEDRIPEIERGRITLDDLEDEVVDSGIYLAHHTVQVAQAAIEFAPRLPLDDDVSGEEDEDEGDCIGKQSSDNVCNEYQLILCNLVLQRHLPSNHQTAGDQTEEDKIDQGVDNNYSH